MKNLSSFALLLCFLFGSLESFSQQIKIDSADPSLESLTVVSIEQVSGSDDFIVFGRRTNFFDYAVVARFTSGGTLVWSKTLGVSSTFNGSTKLSNGNLIGVGQRQIGANFSALIVEISPLGSIVFTKTFSSDTTIYFDSVTADSNGNIYVAGQKGTSTNSRDVALKFSAVGNLLWSTQIPSSASDRGHAREIGVRNDSLFVLGSTVLNGKDITLTVLDTAGGAFLTRRVFDGNSNSNEIYLDGAMNAQGIFFTFSTGGNLAIGKISFATLALSCQPQIVVPNDASSLSGGTLSLRGTEVFISGGAVGVGYGKSFAVKLNQNLGWGWGVLITPAAAAYPSTAFGTASVPLVNGDIAFVDVRYDDVTYTNRSLLTQLTSIGDANDEYCTSPSNFVCQTSGVDLVSITQNLTSVSLVLTETTDIFSGYVPLIAPNCDNNPLPITLLNFTGRPINEEVLLRWSTGSESDNSHFEIVRSSDGYDWQKIGQVTGAGDSQILIDYELVDKNPLNGLNYYRLVSVDFDGTEDYSDVVAIEFASAEVELLIYPNPVSFGQNFNVEGDFQSLEVYGTDGRRFEINKIANQWALSADANPGMYILVAVRADGSTQTTRIVIQ